MKTDREKLLESLWEDEIMTVYRLGKLVNKLERKLRRWKRKSARQHNALRSYREQYGLDVDFEEEL